MEPATAIMHRTFTANGSTVFQILTVQLLSIYWLPGGFTVGRTKILKES